MDVQPLCKTVSKVSLCPCHWATPPSLSLGHTHACLSHRKSSVVKMPLPPDGLRKFQQREREEIEKKKKKKIKEEKHLKRIVCVGGCRGHVTSHVTYRCC